MLTSVMSRRLSSFLLGVILIVNGVLAQQDVASQPFALVLRSANDTLDGTVLTTCHEGAAIEGLCPTYRVISYYTSNSSNVTPSFTFNTSEPIAGADPTPSPQPGLVIFLLRGFNYNLSSPLSLSFNPTSNVALPLFQPLDGQQFVFDEDTSSTPPVSGSCGGLLGIQGTIDDTQEPNVVAKEFVVRRWYVCQTFFGYAYTTLAWTLGVAAPQNPTCVKVEVERLWL